MLIMRSKLPGAFTRRVIDNMARRIWMPFMTREELTIKVIEKFLEAHKNLIAEVCKEIIKEVENGPHNRS